MKVLIRVPLSSMSGYGNDGIGLARAFMRMGADVYLDPKEVSAPLPEDVAMLLTKRLEAPFDLTIVHVDPANLDISPQVKAVSGVTIAWSMWEWSNFGNLKGRSTLRKRLSNFDAVVAYDPVSAQCFKDYTKKPVLTVQGGFWPEDWPYVERDWTGDRFGFCMVGTLNERKDPFVAIQAFQELKSEYPEEFEPAELHLKTVIPGLHSALEQIIPKLRVHYDVWSEDILYKFYAKQHVLLAPSRGEGKNMPALEFQSTGGVVMATNWGGHTQWLHPSYSYPIEYTLSPIQGYPNTYNARASVEDLKAKMLDAFRNRTKTRQMGESAASIIPQMSSWDKVVDNLLRRLSKEVPSASSLWTKAQMSRQEVTNVDN